MSPDGPGDLPGPKSARMQHLRRLSGRRRARRDAGQFVVDGPILVADVLRSGLEVIEVYVEADTASDAAASDVAALADACSVPVHTVAPGTLAKVTSPVTPQAVGALVSIPDDTPIEWRGLVLVLVGVRDPGNAGTLVRVAEAAGATAVVSCADAVDPWNPKCVRASAGSIFRVPVLERADVERCIDDLRGVGMTLLAVDTSGRSIDDVDLTGDVALVLGSEAHGLADQHRRACDDVVAIPMVGEIESLNVAMAGTVLAFEAARQRRARGETGAST